jgi:hypothetical protein
MQRPRRAHATRRQRASRATATENVTETTKVPAQPHRRKLAPCESSALDGLLPQNDGLAGNEPSLTSACSDWDQSDSEMVQLTENTGFAGDSEEQTLDVVDYSWLQDLFPYLTDLPPQTSPQRADILQSLGERARGALTALSVEDAFSCCTLHRILAQGVSNAEQLTDSIDAWLGLTF